MLLILGECPSKSPQSISASPGFKALQAPGPRSNFCRLRNEETRTPDLYRVKSWLRVRW